MGEKKLSFLRVLNQKGQDIVEYAILLAFCAALGYAANTMGFFSVLGDNYSKTAEVAFVPSDIKPLETNVSGNIASVDDNSNNNTNAAKTYSDYFAQWRDTPLSELVNVDKDERVKADKEGLALIAQAFIGQNYSGVCNLMQTFTRGENLKKLDKFDPADGLNGYSEATLVPLSYQLVSEDNGSYYTWLQTEENKNLVSQVLSGNAQIVGRDESGNLKRTKVEDGIFYSDGMISSVGNQLRTVNLRLHYTNGVVDSVDIAARQGGWDGNIVSNLNLNVTESGYTVNDKDYVLKPNLARQ